MSKAQIKRDRKAIFAVLPIDGTPMTMADVLLRAGEGLYPAMIELVAEGTVANSMLGERHAFSRVN